MNVCISMHIYFMNEIVYGCRQLSNCTVIAIFAKLILHSTYMYAYIYSTLEALFRCICSSLIIVIVIVIICRWKFALLFN